MLYYMYDIGRTALDIWAPAARAAQTWFGHPLSPLGVTPMGRAAAAIGEIAERSMRRYAKPELGLDRIDNGGRSVPVTHKVLAARAFGRLLHLRCRGARTKPRVLVVNPLSGHFSALLEDFYAGLLIDHDVYVLEWFDARDVPLAMGAFDLDEQIAYVANAIRRLGPDLHVIGFSQSTVPALAASALAAGEGGGFAPTSLTLIAGPVDTRVNPNALNRFIADHSTSWFVHNAVTHVPVYYPGAFRRVMPGFVQLNGYLSASLEDQVAAHAAFFENLVRGDGESAQVHRDFYDRFLAVMDLPAEFALDMLTRIFDRAELAAGRLSWRGRRVDPGALRDTALMTVEAERDVLAAPGQTHRAHQLCPAIPKPRRGRITLDRAGHLSVVHGRRWRVEILPRLTDFIRRHG